MGHEPFVFIDIETNGGSGPRGRIIEVAAIKTQNGEIIDTYQSFVNPGTSIPYWITRLTGITDNDVVQAPYFADIAAELHRFIAGSIFVAHNALFDYSFLKREFEACGYAFTPKLFCTVKMSRALFSEHRGHSLQKIIERHNLVTKHRHRAYDDALAMYEYTKLTIAQKGIDAFSQNLALQLKTKTLPPNVDEQIILNLPETAGVYIFEDSRTFSNGIPVSSVNTL
jgi:DNA polymerase-3 subunit epsilon